MEKSAPPNPAKTSESMKGSYETRAKIKGVAEDIGEEAVAEVIQPPDTDIAAESADAARRVLDEANQSAGDKRKMTPDEAKHDNARRLAELIGTPFSVQTGNIVTTYLRGGVSVSGDMSNRPKPPGGGENAPLKEHGLSAEVEEAKHAEALRLATTTHREQVVRTGSVETTYYPGGVSVSADMSDRPKPPVAKRRRFGGRRDRKAA